MQSTELALRPSYWASVSGGKDSLFMLNLILHNLDKYPLDGVVHFELEIDYPFIKNVIDYMQSECDRLGIMFLRIKPMKTWGELYERYGFPTRVARWCNDKYKLTAKKQLQEFMKTQGFYTVFYIGYCSDEEKRFAKRVDLQKVERYYKCASAKRKCGCDKKTVRKEWIEDIVVNYTMKKIMDDELVDYLAERILYLLSQENTRIPELKAKLKKVNGYIDNLLNAIQQGLFNSSAKQRLDELESEKSEIETAIYTEQLERPELTKDHIVYFITKFRDININDTESRKRLIDSFVNIIYLYDDKLVITFNYKDGTKEISFEELEKEMCSDIKGLTPPGKDYPNTAVSKSGIRIVFILGSTSNVGVRDIKFHNIIFSNTKIYLSAET